VCGEAKSKAKKTPPAAIKRVSLREGRFACRNLHTVESGNNARSPGDFHKNHGKANAQDVDAQRYVCEKDAFLIGVNH